MKNIILTFLLVLNISTISKAQNIIGNLENLGNTVNSVCWDYRPKISPDGSTLYFTRIGCSGSAYESFENLVFISEMDSAGNWQPARRWEAPFNTKDRNAYIYSISPDNNSLLLTLIDPSTGSRQLCEVYRTATGWGEPKPIDLGITLPRLNSTFCLSNSGKVLIFSFEGNEKTGVGLGEKDLYVSFRQPDGTWSIAKNMGKDINSSALEMGPFLAGDELTLYFSSNRPGQGFGSADLYMSRRLDESWTKWSEPINLGEGLNDNGWNEAFFVPATGIYAYTNSERNAIGAGDIFRVQIEQAIKPMKTMLVEGTVMDDTGNPIEAIIRYEIRPEGQEVGIARTNPTNGRYKIVLLEGKQYTVFAEAEGYYSVSELLDLSTTQTTEKMTRNITLKKLKVGQNILLNNLFFETNSAKLLPASESELKRLAQLLNTNTKIKIQIIGYTDDVGNDDFNQKLSDQRAKTVLDYLVSLGVSATRLSKLGMGEKNPVASNTTEEGRKENRRVEFVIKEY